MMAQSSVIADTVAVTEETFDRDVLAHPGLVLVDVWATWCPSCKMIAPVLAEVARERAGALTVRTLNADENPLTARNYQVMAAPTLLIFRDGELLRTLVGARSKARLLTELDDASH